MNFKFTSKSSRILNWHTQQEPVKICSIVILNKSPSKFVAAGLALALALSYSTRVRRKLIFPCNIAVAVYALLRHEFTFETRYLEWNEKYVDF